MAETADRTAQAKRPRARRPGAPKRVVLLRGFNGFDYERAVTVGALSCDRADDAERVTGRTQTWSPTREARSCRRRGRLWGQPLARFRGRTLRSLGGERAAIDDLLVAQDDSRALEDYELIAQHVSEIAERVTSLENRVSDVLSRLSEVERVNTRLEDAALITARALEEISGHWDAVYEAMRRKDASQEAAER